MSNEFLKTIFHKKFINIDLKKVLKKVENLKIYKIVFFKSIFRNNIYFKKKKNYHDANCLLLYWIFIFYSVPFQPSLHILVEIFSIFCFLEEECRPSNSKSNFASS